MQGKSEDTLKVQASRAALSSSDRFGKEVALDTDLVDAIGWIANHTQNQVLSFSIYVHYIVHTIVFQVAAEREAEISRIENMAAQFRSSGACDQWFKHADPMIAQVISQSVIIIMHVQSHCMYRQPAPSTAHC